MKKITFILLSCVSIGAYAQKDNIGIGTTKPDQSAVLEVSSSNKGFLMPRLSLEQRNNIQNPAKGLIVYQTDMLSGFYFYDGEKWSPLTNSAEKSVAGTDGDWTLSGNAATANDFIGTTNFFPLIFKTAGQRSGFISPNSSSLYLGFLAGGTSTGGANTAIGFGALQNVTTGTDNIALGGGTLAQNTSGNYNVAIGSGTLQNNTSGGGNLAIGTFSLMSNSVGINNIGIGLNSLTASTTGSYNTALGSETLKSNTSGGVNIAIGMNSLNKNTVGSDNVAIGYSSLYNNISGGSNVAIGSNAGYNSTGLRNIFIGSNAAYNENGNDKLYIANSNTTMPLVYGDFAAKFIAIGDVTATLAKRDNLASQYGLLVQKGILTEKIKVATMSSADWADYVFEKDYNLLSLDAVEAFIKENKHLPNVPTTEEILVNGNDIQKTDAKLLEKIEELTLYMIELNKEIKALKSENNKLRKHN